MSHGNVTKELENGEGFPAPSTTVVKVINVTNQATAKYSGKNACILAYGAIVAASTALSSVAGFLSGCLLIDTGGAADAQLYINEGTLSSCDFIACVTS